MRSIEYIGREIFLDLVCTLLKLTAGTCTTPILIL